MQEPSPYFQQYADWLKQRAGRFTAGPPQLLAPYGIQLEDWRLKPIATLYGLAEVTGIPALVRWGQAIIQNRPIAEVEKEYFERIAKELRQAGIGASEEALRRRTEQAAVHAAAAALPLAVPLSRAEAVMLARSLGVGFGFVGAPTAFIRTAQGHPDEALKAFIEAGLAGTIITDAALMLKSLAPSITPEKLAMARSKVAQQLQKQPAGRHGPEADQFVKEVEEALLALKRGDTSKYDALLRRFEEWQAKIDEFKKLYEARQKGPLSPEDEARYTKLLKEVSQIRDKYDLLKMYVESARETGLEAGARRAEFERRTVSDLALAVQEAPPGPPRKDLAEWLLRIDFGFLQKLAKDPELLARHAKRFGVDEQTLAERAASALMARQRERLSELQSEELKKILMDEQLQKKYAAEYGMTEDALRAYVEELLQRRMGIKPPPEKTPAHEKPPIEPAKPPASEKPPIEPLKPPAKEHQFKPPEVETRGGQVLIVREEELKPLIRRLDDLPTVGARLRYLLRRRGRPDEEPPRLREGGVRREGEKAPGRARGDDVPEKTTDTVPDRTADDAPPKTADDTPPKPAEDAPPKLTDRAAVREVERVAEREVVVLDRGAIRTLVPALPAYVFALPAPQVLALISRVVGMPVALAPDVPRPSPREPFGSWLDRVFAGTGFSWRSLAAQKEAFVFA